MKILLKVIKGLVTVFLVLMLILVIFQKVTNSKVALGNVYVFQVVTESMVPKYNVGDIIVVKKSDAKNINIEDDVTYLGSASSVKNLIITHQVVNKRFDNNKYYFTTKGIANEVEDPEINEDNIYGKVIYKTILFSFLGRLMTHTIFYYLIFIVVAASFSYEFIVSHFLKGDDEDEEKEEETPTV